MTLAPGRHHKQDVYVTRSDLHIEHPWSAVDLDYTGSASFFELSSSSPWTEEVEGGDSSLGTSSVFFRAGSKHLIYGSNPYKILHLLSDLGGLLVVLASLGFLLTVCCVRRSLEQSLLKDTF